MLLSAPSAHRGLLLVIRQTGRFCSASQGVQTHTGRQELSLTPRRATRSTNGAASEQVHGGVSVWMTVSEWVRVMAGEHSGEASAPFECSRVDLVDGTCSTKSFFYHTWTRRQCHAGIALVLYQQHEFKSRSEAANWMVQEHTTSSLELRSSGRTASACERLAGTKWRI